MNHPPDRTPLVSIGIPTYNRAASLRRAVESALAQDHPRLEIVISDNASTDETEAICREWARTEPRLRYIRQQVNRGLTANFHAVRDAARGEFFLWLADDDWLAPDYASACLRAMQADAACSLVSGTARYYRDDELVYVDPPIDLLADDPRRRVRRYFSRVERNGVFHGLMRREQVSRFAFQDALGGDMLWVAALAFLGRVRTLPHVYVNRSAKGRSSSIAALVEESSAEVRRGHPRNLGLYIARMAYQDIAVNSPVYRQLGRLGRRRLAAGAYTAMWLRYGLLDTLSRLRSRLGLPAGTMTRLRRRKRGTAGAYSG